MTTNAPSSTLIGKSDFRRRLGYYLTGTAIGCVMAGLLISARARMAQRQEQTQTVQGQPAQGAQADQQAKPVPSASPAR